MNNITTFNNNLFGSVRTLNIDEKYYFVGKDIAEALGYKRPSDAIAQHCKHTVKHRIVDNAGFEQQMNIIPESDVYRLIIKSKLPEAEKFEEWVMEEVLPQLRQCGVVITESATQEAIDYQSKYGIRRIRKTFRETSNLIETWNEFKELSKIERDAHRIDNEDRIKCCKIITDELQDYVANNNLDMKTYEVVMYQEVMLEIKDEINRLSNKRNGGIKSGMTKELNNLKQQLKDATPYTGTPITLDIHGFTTNRLYSDDAYGRKHRSYAYEQWRRKFRALEIPSRENYEIYEYLDFTKPIGLVIDFIAIEDMDADNMLKSFLDALAEHLGLPDDSIFVKCTYEKVAVCDSFDDGKITFSMYQL